MVCKISQIGLFYHLDRSRSSVSRFDPDFFCMIFFLYSSLCFSATMVQICYNGLENQPKRFGLWFVNFGPFSALSAGPEL